MSSRGTKPYLWMLAGSLSFTGMAAFASILTRKCDWQAIAIARAGLVAVMAAVLAYLAGAKLVFLRPKRLWIRSIAGSCSMICTFYAFSRLPVADVLTLTNTFPIWVALISWPLYGKPPGWKMWVAIFVGIAGVALVEQPHLEAANLGVFSALAAAAFTGVAMLGLHSLRGIDPRAIVVHFSTVATVFCVTAYFAFPREHDPAAVFEPLALFELFAMAATATAGQYFLTLAFGNGAPAKVSVVGLTQIVMGLAVGVWLWDHPVNGMTLLGTALVIAPTAWLLTRPAAADVHDPEPGEPQPVSEIDNSASV
jgi:drug/metabolite transporter (DMT)-like permease